EQADLEAQNRERVRLDGVAQWGELANLATERCDREVLEQDPEDPCEREVEDVLGPEVGRRADRPGGRPDKPFAADVSESTAGAAVGVGERDLPPGVARVALRRLRLHLLEGHSPPTREV